MSQLLKSWPIHRLCCLAGVFKTDLDRSSVEVDARGVLFELVVLTQEFLLRSLCRVSFWLRSSRSYMGRLGANNELSLMLWWLRRKT